MSKKTKSILLISICSSLILLLLIGSLVFTFSFNGEIPKTNILYDKDDPDQIIGSMPFPPSLQIPFGTDRDGNHMFYRILEGAQITLGVALLISVLSFLFAFVFGILAGFSKSKSKYITQTLFTSFYFIPQSIIAYNMLHPLLWEPYEGFTTTLTERILLQIIILAGILAPTTAILISSETKQILQKDFITSTIILGGGKFYIFYKHLLPHLKLRLFIIFPKIVIQSLLIIAHLSYFGLYFGGTDICYDDLLCDPPKPFIEEWASMIGMYYADLHIYWWIFLGPMLFLTLTILLLSGVSKGMEGLLDIKPIKHVKSSKVLNSSKKEQKASNLTKKDFGLVHRS
ncbi:ABC transporter permease [Chengkuizengella axinellae]|uniref:ABC transporter permease subunit n=1 Tax=Chengkuizengella axinellae TaxID=3064388 RepID=A0ABT9J4B6_9BACL|nr:ABC transporter permease subunit [Chengkuizengella sp. 2205SS18-9]MDP5276302.1 ABC transporter permease subunit [Chengkuizengella sp. 2205SS18-9]